MSEPRPIDPRDVVRFTLGPKWVIRPPWWWRAWRWLTMLRRPRAVLTVTAVDYEAGIITVDASDGQAK